MNTRPTLAFIVLTTAGLGLFAPAAFAYLDPSTGSMILSAVVGIFATLGLALKTYWYKVKSLFKSGKSAQSESSEVVPGSESGPE
jgi:O-antigen/teichoic acid export membrane protein